MGETYINKITLFLKLIIMYSFVVEIRINFHC